MGNCFPQLRREKSRVASLFLLCALPILLAGTWGWGQSLDEEKFTEGSLQYRTALHYDSMLGQPLEALVKLYDEAERIEELVGLYRSHVEQYPDDAGAKVVLIRILKESERPGVGELIASSVPLHPEFAPLQYLLFQLLEEKGDERAVEALSRAIDLEANSARRAEWLEELLQLSDGETARALAETQLGKLVATEGYSGDDLLALAGLMQRYQFWELSGSALKKAKDAGLSAEQELEADLLTARFEAETGDRESAGKTLDEVLKRLSPDHWKRREIVATRIGVVATEEERAAILERFQKAAAENPESEAAILDYVDILIASDRQSEAARFLVDASLRLPKSGEVAVRTLEVLEDSKDYRALEEFLEARLELAPERSDLRFRLVKVRYALGEDAEAEQDFKAVVAGLEAAAVSDRILELQRFLRSIDRIDAAGVYLEHYVRDNPGRLDVARELGEIYIALDRQPAIEVMVSQLQAPEAPVEEVVDFVEFLMAEEFYAAARKTLDASLKENESNFELGLLQIQVLGELGDAEAASRRILRYREMTDSPERYAKWLEAAVDANEQLGSLDRFFDNEQNRFSFGEGNWEEDKVEKFVLLCEMGKQRLLGSRVADAVRNQLSSGTFDSELKIRLRRFLVGVLENNPASGAEVEEQLKLLASEDPGNRAEYDLRRALLYYRTQRIDLAESLLGGLNLSSVTSAPLVQEAAGVLIEFGFFKEAESALAALNRLTPEDVFSWEKRLTLLAAMGREGDFRSVIRDLREEGSGLRLREDSRILVRRHLVASYWRSIAGLIATGNPRRFEEALPLLGAVDRETERPQDSAWAEWGRAIILKGLGRNEESSEAMARLEALAKTGEADAITFPDGLVLSLTGAKSLLGLVPNPGANPVSGKADRFLGPTRVRWAFEADAGATVEQVAQTGSVVLVRDDRGMVYAVDHDSGKLLWRKGIRAESRTAASRSMGPFWGMNHLPASFEAGTEIAQAKQVGSLTVGSDQLYVVEENEIVAYRAGDGMVAWKSPLEIPEERNGAETASTSRGANTGTILQSDGSIVAAFRPETGYVTVFSGKTGKKLWQKTVGGEGAPGDRVYSLNSGLSLEGGLLFLYGWETSIHLAETGERVWTFSSEDSLSFPLTLRKYRNEEVEGAPVDTAGEVAANAVAPTRAVLIDFLDRDLSAFRIGNSLPNRSSLVGPAVHWARARLRDGSGAMGVLQSGYLWLMRDGEVRRVSFRLPVASRSLPGTGAYLGTVQNHLWLLEEGRLHHLDFNVGRAHVLDISDIGSEGHRIAREGNQFLISGETGFKVVNALTGRSLGTALWPEELQEYIQLHGLGKRGESREAWQGWIPQDDQPGPKYCYPVRDLILEDAFLTRFGSNSVVCLEEQPATEEEAIPPAE